MKSANSNPTHSKLHNWLLFLKLWPSSLSVLLTPCAKSEKWFSTRNLLTLENILNNLAKITGFSFMVLSYILVTHLAVATTTHSSSGMDSGLKWTIAMWANVRRKKQWISKPTFCFTNGWVQRQEQGRIQWCTKSRSKRWRLMKMRKNKNVRKE